MSLHSRKAGTPPPSCRPHLEQLEVREVLYAVSGNAWAHPERVTISFVPDGTDVGGVASNLFSVFNARFGRAAVWQKEISRAAQLWAQQTNLNFSVVSDNGAPLGGGDYQQGDPGFGDIRISGFDFGTSTLAQAYLPPPVNNYSVAGDLQFNTSQGWNIGSTYDLFTVSVHEIGHALGLDHSTVASANLYPGYNGTKSALTSDDITGIRSIYGGARSIDAYDASGSNGTVSTADDVTALLGSRSKSALLTDLDITTSSDVDYYKVVVPAGSASTLQVRAQSSGLSLLNLKLSVLASNGSTVLGSASAGGLNGGTASVSVGNVTTGQVLYIKVQGMDTTAMSTGEYALGLNLGTGLTPTPTIPDTRVLNGGTLSSGGGQLASVVKQSAVAIYSAVPGESSSDVAVVNRYGVYEAMNVGAAMTSESHARRGSPGRIAGGPSAGAAKDDAATFLTWTDRSSDLTHSPAIAAADSVVSRNGGHLLGPVDVGEPTVSGPGGVLESLFLAPPTNYTQPAKWTVSAPRLPGFTVWADTATETLP